MASAITDPIQLHSQPRHREPEMPRRREPEMPRARDAESPRRRAACPRSGGPKRGFDGERREKQSGYVEPKQSNGPECRPFERDSEINITQLFHKETIPIGFFQSFNRYVSLSLNGLAF